MKAGLKILVSAVLALSACSSEFVERGEGLTGTWSVEVEATSGPGSPTFGLVQTGEQITGNYDGALGTSPVTGTIKGSAFQFAFSVTTSSGRQLDVKYDGTLSGDTMSGNVSMAPLGTGTFTGVKQ